MPRRSKRSLSLGNDLPHMPEAPRESILLPPQSYGRASNGAQAAPIPPLTTSTSNDGTLTASSTRDNFKQYPQCADDDLLDDEAANAMLLSRETQRLRLMTPLKLKRRARIAAGAAVLPLIALTSYCLARYVIAWLHFGAPITFNPDGTTAAAAGSGSDPLLRTMSLLSVILTSYSLLLFLLSALYLRFTRTTSTASSIATPTIFFAVLLAGTIAIAMSLANVGLIVAWHKYYGLEKHKADATARTRDVARRCAGEWEFDLIWGAPLVGQEACTQEGGQHAVQLFLVAAALRAALYLVFVVLFLHLLRRYNRLLRLGPDTLLIPGKAPVDGDEEKLMHGGKVGGTVKESAEMHQLLAEQRAAAAAGGYHHHYHPHGEVLNDEATLTSPDAEKAAALLGDARTGRGIDTHGGYAVTMASVPPSASTTPAAPRLSRFNWQRGEPSHGAPAALDDAGYEQYAHAQQGSTGADGWGAAIYRRLWSASGHAAVPTRDDDEENVPTLGHDAYYSRDLEAAARQADKHQQQHSKGPSRLGISGWFGRGGDAASDDGENDDESEGHSATQAETSLTRHERTPSQERRRLAHRHAASARRSSAGAAAPVSLPGSRRNSSSSSVESQKYGDDLPAMPGLTDVPPPQPRQQQQQQQQRASSSRSRSTSASPTIPTPQLPPRPTPPSSSAPSSSRPSVPSYVRHLGRMVQKLPSIKSGDGDGSSSRNASESSAAAPLPSPGLVQQPHGHGHGHGHGGRRRSSSSSRSGGEQWRSLGGVEEEGEEEVEGQHQQQHHHQEAQAERAFPGAWQW